MTVPDRDDHVARNRAAWNIEAAGYVEPGRRGWASEPSWGIWGIPESEAHLLPEVDGLDVIELGCGTAYVSSWLARRGARPVGIDLSENQLATARALQDAHDLHFPLIQCSAEAVPLADASFDLAISEYGAAIWCDPYRWIPEAARLLRPGGRLIFLGNGALLMLTVTDSDADGPAGTTLRRDYFGMHRFEWPDEQGVEFHLTHGDWIRLLRRTGFAIEDLIELQAPPDATTRYPFVTLEWARRWPSEEVWVARKTGPDTAGLDCRTMPEESWTAVDEYITGRLQPADPVLAATVADSAALPNIAVAPAQGQFLQLLVLTVRARRILEIGTLGGYSAIWMARALPEDGRLISLEISEAHASVARRNIARAGLEGKVEVRVAPALETLAQLKANHEEAFDLVFIDADKRNTPEYFSAAIDLAHAGTLIVVDNVVRQGKLIDLESDPDSAGMRRLIEQMAADDRITPAVIQTVGVKGWDGFAFALVKG